MKWNFPATPAGEFKGLNEAGIQIFREDTISGLAREICQNSLDARDDDLDPSIPVVVEFNLFSIPMEQFPDVDQLIAEFEACKRTAIASNDNQAEIWTEKCIGVLNRKTLPILRISDFNTTGLLGAMNRNHTQPWGSLVNARESSVKKGTAGGSFGIGKFATFSCSSIRTVFFSTYSKDGVRASQGIARLVSSRKIINGEDRITTAFGYHGKGNGDPATIEAEFDKSFSRTENQFGTDIYIAGFTSVDDDSFSWQSKIILSVLEGFLLAIYEGRLEVVVGDIKINTYTLGDLINEYRQIAPKRVIEYYEVLTSDETHWETDPNFLKSYGEIKLGILVKEGYSQRIGGIRSTGMLVHEFKQRRGLVEYAGLLLLKGDGINSVMRLMENPQHTKWSESFIEGDKTQGRLALRGIKDFYESTLKKIFAEDETDQFDAGIGDFLTDITENEAELPDDTQNESINDTIEEITSGKKVQSAPIKSTKQEAEGKYPIENPGDNSDVDEFGGGGGHGEGKASQKGTGFGQDEGKGPGGELGNVPLASYGPIHIERPRVLLNDRKTNSYLLFFTPNITSEDATIQIYIASEGRSSDMPVEITSCTIKGQSPKFSGNKIKGVLLEEGVEIKIKFDITFNELCSMEFRVNGYR